MSEHGHVLFCLSGRPSSSLRLNLLSVEFPAILKMQRIIKQSTIELQQKLITKHEQYIYSNIYSNVANVAERQ